MIVTPAKPEDLPAIREIVTRCGLHVEGLDYAKWTGVLLVCTRQGQVIGFISALPGHPYAVITEIGVLPEHQKSRACSKLMEGMELILRSLGCTAWSGYVGEKRLLSDTLTTWGAECTGAGSMWIRRL